MPSWIGICLGDPTGIGPEITLKALASELPLDDVRYLLIGDAELARRLSGQLKLSLPIQSFEEYSGRARVCIHNPLAKSLPGHMPPGAAAAARAAVAWLEDGAQRCLRGEVNALVAAPVNKAAIIRAGKIFIGQTEHLAQMAGANRFAMMLLGQDDRERWLRVVLVTTHLPIKDVAASITQAKVELAIEMAALACRQLGLSSARIGVCGLNPHAGESGNLGAEEIKVIAPAAAACQKRGIDATPPMAADALFYRAYRGDFDVVVAMYHDQGLAPLKMIGFEKGVNWTVGLPFIRTSPDHGTAYDIAGQNRANPSSMIAALRLAKRIQPAS